MKENNKWIFIAVIFITAIVVWALWPQAKVTPVDPDKDVMHVTVTHPIQQTISETLNLSGVVIPREEIIITSELANVRVETVTAEEGMIIKKGQRLATFDGESFRNQLAQLDAAYIQAKGDFDRVEAIKDSGAISKELYAHKRAVFLAAKAQRDDASLSVKRCEVVSPEAGLIYERQARIGALVSSSDPLFRIVKDGELELEANVAEADIARLHTGQKMAVIVVGSDNPIEGIIRLISPRIDNANRTARVRITLDQDSMVPVGAFGQLHVTTRQTAGMALPPSAVLLGKDGPFVWQVIGAKVRALLVTVSLRSANAVLIESDTIQADMQIVARAGHLLREGDTIIPTEDTP